MRFRTWLIAALLFGSGFCALVYEVGWLRDFRLIFGASTAASAAVLAIFIGGLGLGGLLLGPRADRHPRPLLWYAQLEMVVAASAAATPLLLAVVRYLYLASGGSTRLGGPFAEVARVVLSTIVLAVPTIAMGGTLPAAARAATRDTDVRRQDVAALYALNTFGAVLGCIVATFWLLELLGTRSTLWLASGINLLVAFLAMLVARSFDNSDSVGADSVGAARRTKRGPKPSLDEVTTPQVFPPAAAPPTAFLLTASAVVGFSFFLMELVWYRMLAPLLGGSVFTFGLVLAVALVGVGVGGLVYALVAADTPASLSGFASTCLIEATAVAATFAIGDRVAMLTLTMLPLQAAGWSARIAGWAFVTLIVVLPPALVAGYQFPLLIALFGRARDEVGKQIGRAYAANTAGAIVGSLAGGFGLLPWLSATGAWQLVAMTLVALGGTAFVLSGVAGNAEAPAAPTAAGSETPVPGAPRQPARTATALGRMTRGNLRGGLLAALALASIALVTTAGPTAVWRHSGIGAGRVAPAQVLASPNRLREWTTGARHAIVWEGDGVESSVALTRNPNGYAFVINGKSDGNARGDAGTQVVAGLIGALTNPGATRALVIGLGTGSTAGWLGAVPSIDRVDVIELEPLVIEVARACAPVNHNVLENEKVHITIGDARETLLTTRDRYDLIVSEPSNPYRAGIASLFTEEYYRAATDRLTDGGVFVQWVQTYGIDTHALRTIYATLAAVFPQVDTWYTNPGDLVLIASKQRHTYRAGELTRRIAVEPFRSALAQAWRAVDIHGLLAHYVANDSLARSIAGDSGVEINTDDRNIIEFGLARTVGLTLASVGDVREAARAAGVSRPPLDDDSAIRWPEVDTAWMSANVAGGAFPGVRADAPPREQARQSALLRYYGNDDLSGAARLWEQQAEAPRDPTEMAMLADIAGSTGLDAALPFIEGLRAYQPGEADTLLARLRLQQLKLGEAATAVESAVTRFRTDPWPMTRFMADAVQIAELIGTRDSALARRMFDALGQPFAVGAVDDARLMSRAALARQIDFPGLCGDAVMALEPYVPWNENFLRLRRDCYAATNNPRLASSIRDLDEFVGNLAPPLLP